MVPRVRSEALYIRDAQDTSKRVTVDAALLSNRGVAFVETELADAEKALAVRFVLSVNDGEAEALAVASIRKLPIFSDDTAAIRVASSEGMRRETTLDMVLTWSSTADPNMVTKALLDLARLANYIPPRSHPLREWYDREVSR